MRSEGLLVTRCIYCMNLLSVMSEPHSAENVTFTSIYTASHDYPLAEQQQNSWAEFEKLQQKFKSLALPLVH